MPKRNYITLPRLGEFQPWVEQELRSVERAIASIPATLAGEDVAATTYTLVLGDQDKVLTTTSGSAVTISVPTNESVPFELGTMVYFYQEGDGLVTLQGVDGTVTVRSRPGLKSGGKYALFFIWKQDDNVWVASGDLTT
jgi:hypothetical protein